MGETCGRRERRTDRGTRGGAILSRAQVATVEGTQIRYEVVSLRGWAIQSESWSVRTRAEGSFLGMRSHRRQRVSSGCKRRGTSSACDKASRTLLGSRPTSTFEFEDTSFAQSRDPCNVSHGIAHAAVSLSRSGKLTQVRGTGTGGEATGRLLRGSPHLAGLERGLISKELSAGCQKRKLV